MTGGPEADAADKVTVLIPTRNRHPRLVRALRYLAACPPRLRVSVLDSSDRQHDGEDLSGALAAYGADYVRFGSDIGLFPKLAEGLAKVSTPYTQVCADDDFIVPSSVCAAACFLDDCPDHSIAHGIGTIAYTQSVGGRNLVVALDEYPQSAVLGATAEERLMDHLVNGSTTFYSLHRTSQLSGNIAALVETGLGYPWGEYLASCLSIIQGKAAKLDRLYLVREGHSDMASAKLGASEGDFFDVMTGTEAGADYAVFRDRLASEMAEVEGLSEDQARAAVKKAWWGHLVLGLAKKYTVVYGTPPPRGALVALKRAAKQIPWLRDLVGLMRGIAVRSQGADREFSLASLLKEASPHYVEFAGAYRALTGDIPDDPRDPGRALGDVR